MPLVALDDGFLLKSLYHFILAPRSLDDVMWTRIESDLIGYALIASISR